MMMMNARRMDNPNEYAFGWQQQQRLKKKIEGQPEENDDTNSLDNAAAKRNGAPDVGVVKNKS